jgi:hypothetical protein
VTPPPSHDSWSELPKISRPEQTTSEHLRSRAALQKALLAAEGDGKPPENGKAEAK